MTSNYSKFQSSTPRPSVASLHHDPRGKSPFWYCAYRLGDGRRTLRSTGEEDRKRARIVCDGFVRIAEEESRADTSRDLMERIVEDTMRRLGHDRAVTTVEDWLGKWLKEGKETVSEATHEKYSQVVREFLGSLGPRKTTPIGMVSDADVIRFRDSLVSSGRSASTVNTMVRVILKRAFRVAVDSGIIPRNPVATIRPLKVSKATKGIFTPQQVRSLLEVASGDWQGLILAGWYTGARLGDLSRLRWSSVDMEERTIRFVQGKTGREVRIPIAPELGQWLQAEIRLRGGFVFETLHSKATCELSNAFTRLMAQAGIESTLIREAKGTSGRNISSLTFHSFRHSFNSTLANNGVSQELRQLLTGHSSAQSNTIYTHLDLATLRQAIGCLPKIN